MSVSSFSLWIDAPCTVCQQSILQNYRKLEDGVENKVLGLIVVIKRKTI